MQFVELAEYPVQYGTVTNWVPTAQRPPERWEKDRRATSHIHEQHLRSAINHFSDKRTHGGRESWLGVGIEFDEPLSFPTVRKTLQLWINRHEVLRTYVYIRRNKVLRRTTGVDKVVVTPREVGHYRHDAQVLEQLQGTFDRETAPMTWPAYSFTTVSREDSFSLFFAADHSLVDGYSLALAPFELKSLYKAVKTGADVSLMDAGSYIDFSAAERSLADASFDDHPAIALWRDFLDDIDWEMPMFPMSFESGEDLIEPGQRIAQARLTSHILDAEATERFSVVARQGGGNFFAGILATMAAINSDLTSNPVFRCIIPRHTRTASKWVSSLGWFIGITPLRIDTTGAASFNEVVARAAAALHAGKPAAELPFLRVGEILGHLPNPRFVVSYIDTRLLPLAAESDAGMARVLRSRNYSLEDVYVWVNRTPSGLHISARFPGLPHTQMIVNVYLNALRALLTEIGHTGELPHFPLSRSSEDSL